jgi:hypothetical protein
MYLSTTTCLAFNNRLRVARIKHQVPTQSGQEDRIQSRDMDAWDVNKEEKSVTNKDPNVRGVLIRTFHVNTLARQSPEI